MQIIAASRYARSRFAEAPQTCELGEAVSVLGDGAGCGGLPDKSHEAMQAASLVEVVALVKKLSYVNRTRRVTAFCELDDGAEDQLMIAAIKIRSRYASRYALERGIVEQERAENGFFAKTCATNRAGDVMPGHRRRAFRAGRLLSALRPS